MVAARQVDGVDAVERRDQRGGVGEVAHRPVDACGQVGGRVADERPYRQAAADELGNEVAADGAGRADDEGGWHGANPAPWGVPGAFLSVCRSGTLR